MYYISPIIFLYMEKIFSKGGLMEYPHFRLKLVVVSVIVFAIAFLIHQAVQISYWMLYGKPDLVELVITLLKALLISMLPPFLIYLPIFYLYLNPIHRVVLAITHGTKPSEDLYIRARKILTTLPWITLAFWISTFLFALVIIGFSYTKEVILSLRGLIAFLRMLSTGAVCGFIAVNIYNIILTKPRAMLKIYYFDKAFGHFNAVFRIIESFVTAVFSLKIYDAFFSSFTFVFYNYGVVVIERILLVLRNGCGGNDSWCINICNISARTDLPL